LIKEGEIIMDTKKSLFILVVVFVMLAFSTHSWAGINLPLMAVKTHPNAIGTAYFNEDNLSIQAKGLRPNEVYTVWFVNMKPKKHEIGAGSEPYMFKTDSNGNGSYEAVLSESPFEKWEMIMIVLHPTGNPRDMKNMIGALSAKIPANK
jgi:hypothetical protein